MPNTRSAKAAQLAKAGKDQFFDGKRMRARPAQPTRHQVVNKVISSNEKDEINQYSCFPEISDSIKERITHRLSYLSTPISC